MSKNCAIFSIFMFYYCSSLIKKKKSSIKYKKERLVSLEKWFYLTELIWLIVEMQLSWNSLNRFRKKNLKYILLLRLTEGSGSIYEKRYKFCQLLSEFCKICNPFQILFRDQVTSYREPDKGLWGQKVRFVQGDIGGELYLFFFL